MPGVSPAAPHLWRPHPCATHAPPSHPAQVIYACNVLDSDLESGNDMVKQVAQLAAAEGASHVVVSAQVLALSCRGPRGLPRHGRLFLCNVGTAHLHLVYHSGARGASHTLVPS
jgi:uncharacterized Zn-finger protein